MNTSDREDRRRPAKVCDRGHEELMSTEMVDEVRGTVAVASGDAVVDRVTQNWKIIVGAVIAIAVVAVGYWWYTSAKAQENEAANIALSRIRATYESGDFEKALTGKGLPPIDGGAVLGLQSIVEQYGSTDAGKVAALMAGTAYLNIGKAAEARGAFEIAQGSNAPVVMVGALNGLGACAELDKDLAAAASYYEKAADAGNRSGLEPRSLIYAAMAYEKAGNTQKAGELYTTVAKKYAQSDMSQPARAGLARLGMRID